MSKITWLDWSKMEKQTDTENFFVSIRQTGKQALGLEFSFLKI